MKTVLSFLLMFSCTAIWLSTPARACKTHWFIYRTAEEEEEYLGNFNGYSYDGDDSACFLSSDSHVPFSNDAWETLKCSGSHCKVEILDQGSDAKPSRCDSISSAGSCDFVKMLKVSCDEHYIYYAGNNTVCTAALDGNGDVMADSDGYPYGNCDCSRRFLRDD